MITSLFLYKKFSSLKLQISNPKYYTDRSYKEGGAFLSVATGKGDGTYDTENAFCVFLSSGEVSEIIHAMETDFESYSMSEKNPYQFSAYHDYENSGTGIVIGRNKEKDYVILLNRAGKSQKYYFDKLEKAKISMYLKSLYQYMFIWEGEITKKETK